MSMFRKYLNETDVQKDIQPQISLLQDIETFMTSKDSKQKKEAASAHIFKWEDDVLKRLRRKKFKLAEQRARALKCKVTYHIL